MMKRSCLAFTLTELLVAVAILALLIALAVPAVSQAIRKSREIEATSAIKTWGDAFLQYAADNNMRLPTADNTHSTDTSWQSNVSKMVYGEPKRFLLRNEYKNPNADPLDWGFATSLYLVDGLQTVRSLNQIERPVESFLIVDSSISGIRTLDDPGDQSHNSYPAYDRNNGRALFYFADGHIEMLSEEQAQDSVLVTGE